MSWINDLDALASAGVISFDAPAYIKGTTPRYYGNPPLETIPGELPPMKQQPSKDEFNNGNGTAVHNPSWKKWLFGGLAAGAILLGGYKAKGFLIKLFKKAPKPAATVSKPKFAKRVWNKITAGFGKVTEFFKNLYGKVKAKFKKP